MSTNNLSISSAVNVESVSSSILHCVDTVVIPTNEARQLLFQNLNVCSQRMHGRAMGKIVGDLHFSLLFIPGRQIACAVGIAVTGTTQTTASSTGP
jgi:hypothetical protein